MVDAKTIMNLSYQEKEKLACDENTSLEILEILDSYSNSNYDLKCKDEIYEKIEKNNSCEDEIGEEIEEDDSCEDDVCIQFCVLYNPKIQKLINEIKLETNCEKLDDYAKINISSVKVAVIENSNTSINTLERLMNDKDYEVKWALAVNDKMSFENLSILSKDCNVKGELIKNSKIQKILEQINVETNSNILEEYSKIEIEDIQLAVARNPNTPEKILRLFSENENYLIREAVAENINIPIDILKAFANNKNESKYVKRAVAENPNVPIDILKFFIKTEKWYVQSGVATNLNLPTEDLTKLAQHKIFYVRKAVASNPNTPENILQILAKDKIDEVRIGVASNSNVSKDILINLLKDENYWVIMAFATNQKSKEILNFFLDNMEEINYEISLKINVDEFKNISVAEAFDKLFKIIH